MNIHEFQAKDLMRQYGVPVPAGSVAHSVEQAEAVAEELGVNRFVVKAQIHAGGRGKGGGVKLAHTVEEVRTVTDEIIGRPLITAQTGPQGQFVRRVLIEQAVDIAREAYFGLVIDRTTQRITIIACDGGGVEIEETARHEPERILREPVDPAVGLLDFQCRKVATHLKISGKQLSPAVKMMKALYRCFRDNDAVLIEVNPLAVTLDGRLLALDAKMQFDDNAIYRRPHISNLRDFDEEDPKEVEAGAHGLNYIALEGNVGCIVNGAGLAMATMDAIALHDGQPANFLDVGGGASPEKVTNAFRIVLLDKNVKAVLVNIFAGINRCDWIAEGIVRAMRELEVTVPVVVRLAGTNVEQGRAVLAQSGLKFLTANNLDDAAAMAVRATSGAAHEHLHK
ncbi:MAG: ADP-forming succinate--CoA ligase subunit beta [Gammaproteobacteria bacterium]|nr:ADP-forming succinate--CoA ligase subunit beta [Gammaproteobacteria bacterium]MDH3562179.1 ADP-forming succinate--CoA ligase subunit beta [Gammaproteobacteria bacterium]